VHLRAPFAWTASTLVWALVGASACRDSTGPSQPLVPVTIAADSSPLRILFIGNSLTFFNDLPARTAEIAARDATLRPADVQSVTVSGQTLLGHWHTGQAQQTIQSGHWDYVVLQEQSSGILQPLDSTAAVVQRFTSLATRAGARTVLYVTWAPEGSGALQDSITRGYESVARAAGTLIAPLGVAWQHALDADSTLPLYADTIHPTPLGTYLLACTMFATLYRHSPVGLAGATVISDTGVTMVLDSAEAARLQITAWQATQPYLPH